jgi:hypothetical protein
MGMMSPEFSGLADLSSSYIAHPAQVWCMACSSVLPGPRTDSPNPWRVATSSATSSHCHIHWLILNWQLGC